GRETILGNFIFEVGPNQFFSGQEFAQKFSITDDRSVLPAADEGNVASGADFHDPSVDPLGIPEPLALLPPEELPPIAVLETIPVRVLETQILGVPNPALNITKGASVPGGTADHAGEQIHYTITVANTGNETLTGVTVNDPYADAGSLVRGADIVGNNDN